MLNSIINEAKNKEKKNKVSTYDFSFTFSTLVIMILLVFILIIATFTQITVTKIGFPTFILKHFVEIQNYNLCYKFIPQVPAVLFIGAILGKKYGLISIILYIITGLFLLPVFALGGGVAYVLQYSFGFILAFTIGVYISGKILEEFNFINVLLATIISVITIHVIGVIYMILIFLMRSENLSYILNWISVPSGIKIYYDILYGFFAINIGYITKKFLWFILK